MRTVDGKYMATDHGSEGKRVRRTEDDSGSERQNTMAKEGFSNNAVVCAGLAQSRRLKRCSGDDKSINIVSRYHYKEISVLNMVWGK